MQIRALIQTLYGSAKVKFGLLLIMARVLVFFIDNIGRYQTVASVWPSLKEFLTSPTVTGVLPWIELSLLSVGIALILWGVWERVKPDATLPTQESPVPQEHKPVVLLKYEWEEHDLLGTPIRVIRNKPFLLLSRDADVFDVQIQPIVRQCGTATFESISSILKGSEASILANIEGVGVLQQHDLEILLIKEWEAGGDISKIGEPIFVSVSVTYSDSQGRKFKTEHEVKYKPLHKTAKTHFKGVLAE